MHLWWPDGDTNHEGMEIENLFTSLGLSQIISEPTNFEPNKNPSCIDLIATDQPNLILYVAVAQWLRASDIFRQLY